MLTTDIDVTATVAIAIAVVAAAAAAAAAAVVGGMYECCDGAFEPRADRHASERRSVRAHANTTKKKTHSATTTQSSLCV